MSEPARVVHASVKTPSGTLTLCDIGPADLDAVVQYWHFRGDEHLEAMGIDRSRLGTPADTEQRILRAIRNGNANQRNIAFAIKLEGEFIGYTLLNRYSAEVNYSHWHIVRPELRGRGISTVLYPHRIEMYFDLIMMNRLIHQTRTSNVGVNHMLDRYVPIAETCYVEHPDGVASPGHFYLRYVNRQDIPGLFKKAAPSVW